MKTLEAQPLAMRALMVVAAGLATAGCGASSAPGGSTAGTAVPSATATPTSSPTPPQQATANHGAPSTRQQFAAGYDPVTRSLLIEGGFAGFGSTPIGETWSWDGAQWHRLADGPRVEGASLTADPVSGHLLLIGGGDGGRSATAQTGTWSWTGASWTRVGDNPAEGAISQATTDPAHKQVLVNATGPTGVCVPSEGCQTPPPYEQYGHYVWDGSAWKNAATNLAEYHGSTGAALGFDPISSRVIQQGDVAQADGDATLAWDGAVWTLLKPDSLDVATAEAFQGTAANDGHMLLMLGDAKTSNTNIASTWSFDGNNWQRHVVNEPAVGASLVYDAAVNAFVAVGAVPGSRGALDVWVLKNLTDGWQVLPH
jgi:hypothetical protein